MIRFVASLVLAFGFLAAPAQAQDDEPIAWLFVQTAERMSFDGVEIVLTGLQPGVAFGDRPYRIARRIAVADFVALWAIGGDGFAGDPPNAGLTVLAGGGLEISAVILSEPRLDGDTLTFAIEIIEGTVSETGTEISLFIDATVNSQVTDALMRGSEAAGGR